jgi:hypothetical protein
MGLLEKGYLIFMAKVKDFNDGKQDCTATLTAIHAVTKARGDFEGSTKNGHGHAELDAIYQFLKAIRWDLTVYTDYSIQVTCTSKPCCVYCSAVMGLMGIVPGHDTYKINKSMGISYAIPPDIRNFLVKCVPCKLSEVESELQG